MIFNFERFYINSLGLVLGAFPFLFLGVVVATYIQLYGKNEWFAILAKGNPFLSHVYVAVFGLFIPVCECGNIPVVKKLMARGFGLSHAVTYLLAAPIVNPVTILTTYQAFSDFPGLIAFRILGGFVISIVLGMSFLLIKNPRQFIAPVIYNPAEEEQEDHHAHHHKNKIEEFTSHFVKEFVDTFKYLFIGSIIAGFFQTIVPREFYEQIGSNAVLSLLVMIVFAFVVSVCSHVDAFIALSFSNVFSNASLLGFMVFGPMMDIKTITMLKGIFTLKFSILLTCMIFGSTTLLVCTYYLFNLIGFF